MSSGMLRLTLRGHGGPVLQVTDTVVIALSRAAVEQVMRNPDVFSSGKAPTDLKARLGDAAAGKLLRKHSDLARRALAEAGDGTILKDTGDGAVVIGAERDRDSWVAVGREDLQPA